MSNKRYVKGWCKEKETQYGTILSLSINKEDFNKLPLDKYGNVQLTIASKKSGPDNYGNTHSVRFNDYGAKQAGNMEEDEGEDWEGEGMEDDLPF